MLDQHSQTRIASVGVWAVSQQAFEVDRPPWAALWDCLVQASLL